MLLTRIVDEDEEAGMDDVVRKKAQETTKLIKNSNKRLDSAIKIMDDTGMCE